MPSENIVLLIDSSEEDRSDLRSILGAREIQLIEASSAAEAWEKVRDCDVVHMMIMGLTPEHGGEILDLRDHLHLQVGLFPSVLCSREDMTPFYPRVLENERLFFKPVNRGVLLEWVDANLGASTGKSGEGVAGGAVESTTLPVSSPPPEIETAPAESSATETLPRADSTPIQLPEEALPVGTRLGDYKLLREIQRDEDFALYEAEQTSIGRRVALKTLYRKHRKDINWVQGFVNEASARASVNHPSISLVYECDQELGVNFYTLELVDAPSLTDLARRRSEVEETSLWKVLAATADALVYLRENGMSHRLISAHSILMLKSGEPRIANPVRGRGEPLSPGEERRQMELIAEAISPFLKKSGGDPALHLLVERMGSDRIDAVNTIDALKRVISPPDPKEELSEVELAKLNEKEHDKKAIVVGTLIGLVLIGGLLLAFLLLGSKPELRSLDELSKIPDGVFPYQDKEEIDVPEFWIGRYEVTIAEYAKFLDALEETPSLERIVRHPEQPEEKTSFRPDRWDEIYSAAQRSGKFYGGAIDLNCPVIGVDWWDAHAFATWRGGRLPSEQEWEKAARGRSGSLFPWGDQIEPSNFNSGLDHEDSDTVKEGRVDGYKFWAPADAFPTDESRYGVIGLAGNVSEWTATWDTHPESPDRRVPVKRGASFVTKSGFELTARRVGESAEERNFWTGFRIAADSEAPQILTEGGTPSAPPPPTTPAEGGMPSEGGVESPADGTAPGSAEEKPSTGPEIRTTQDADGEAPPATEEP